MRIHLFLLMMNISIGLSPIQAHDAPLKQSHRKYIRPQTFLHAAQNIKDYLKAIVSAQSLVKNHPLRSAIFSFGVGGIATKNKYAAAIICLTALHIRKNQLIHDTYLAQLRNQVFTPINEPVTISQELNQTEREVQSGWFYRNFPAPIRAAINSACWCINKTAGYASRSSRVIKDYSKAILSLGPELKKHPMRMILLAASAGGLWTHDRDISIALLASALVAYKHHYNNRRELRVLLAESVNAHGNASFNDITLQCSSCAHPKVLPIYCLSCAHYFCKDCAGSALFCPLCNGTLSGNTYRTIDKNEPRSTLKTKNQISKASDR